MKKYTALISRLLAVMLAFGITTASATEITTKQQVSIDNEQTVSQYDGQEYAEDIKILEAIGVIKGYKEGTFNPQEKVTRSELAMLGVCMMGEDIIKADGELMYHDVPSTYWASEYIGILTAMDIMVGNDGYFHPEEFVNIEQASKVMVEILGYKNHALITGGYPKGYLSVARDFDLFDRIQAGGELTRGKLSRLILNTLLAKPYNIVINNKQEKTLMEKNFNVKFAEGRVESNHLTSLWGQPACPEDCIVINDVIYTIPDSSYNDFLGREVEFYYIAHDDKTEEILHADLLNRKGEEYVVISENICDDNPKFGINTFVFIDEKGKQKERNIQGAFVILNGKASNDGITKNDLSPSNGKVTLIDDDGDRNIDIVYVESYRTAVVSIVNTLEGIIVDKLGGEIINTENIDVLEVQKDGKNVVLSALKEDDVLLITESKDKSIVKISASSKTVSGIVTAFSEEGITIDNQVYKMNPIFDTNKIKSNSTMTFGMDSEGRVAYIITLKTEGQYAYLFKVNHNTFDETITFKLFNQSGEHKTLEGAEKIRFNNEGKIKYDDLASKLKGGKERADTFIFYKTDDEGKINHIYMPDADCEQISPDYPRAERHFSKSLSIFGMYEKEGFSIDPTVPMFYIVEGDDWECRMITMADLADKTPYIAAGYGAGDTLRPKMISVFIEEGSESDVEIIWSTPVGVITNISTTVNDDLEPVPCVQMFTRGQKLKIPLARNINTRKAEFPSGKQTAADFSEFKRGDVVFYTLNHKGEISGICRILPFNKDGEIKAEVEWVVSHGFSAGKIFGTANRLTNGLLEVTVNGDGYLFPVVSAPVVIIDMENDEIYSGSMEQLIPKSLSPGTYSKVFLKAGGGVISDAVIYTNWQ